MTLDFYQIDSFSDRCFGGNPAAVVPLAQWLPDDVMQAVAQENNLSETAFFVPVGDGFRLRWFTPTSEVELCGHATLASAYVLYELLDYDRPSVSFQTLSGELTVRRGDDGFAMDLPALQLTERPAPPALAEALGAAPRWSGRGKFWLLEYACEADIIALAPDFASLRLACDRNVIVTAAGEHYDFVSRFFAPHVGINEDPVTGSAHCSLTPYWAKRLGKSRLKAKQVSPRGGELECELLGDRVRITGQCVTYLQGKISL
jgi:predicted PhzF superfamily epimerase YddE/YHI9